MRRPTGRAALLPLVVIAIGLVMTTGCRRMRFMASAGDASESPEPEPAAPPGPAVPCAEGLETLASGACFAAPKAAEGRAEPWPLVIYLHGIFDPSAASEELNRQARVASHATARGFAVLALHGHVGECSAPEYANRMCWPSNEKNEEGGPAFVAEWKGPLGEAEHRGAKGKRYVLGFSNGGYFSSILAERALFPADGFVVARGGPVSPIKASGAKVPMLLTFSDDDPSHDEMMKLDEGLTADGWTHEKFQSEGGHALPDADIEAALGFFTKLEHAAPR